MLSGTNQHGWIFQQYSTTLSSDDYLHLLQRRLVDKSVDWLDSRVFESSRLTMRHTDPTVELEYIRFIHNNPWTWGTAIICGALSSGLFVVHIATSLMTVADRYVAVALLSIAASFSVALFVNAMCSRSFGYAPNVADRQRSAYLSELLASALCATCLISAGYFAITASTEVDELRLVKPQLEGSYFNSFHTAVLLLMTAAERPRSIVFVPCVLLGWAALLFGVYLSDAQAMFADDPDLKVAWATERNIELYYFAGLSVVCCLVRITRERQHRRHFQQFSRLFAKMEVMKENHNEFVKVVERFVPPFERAVNMNIDATSKAACVLIEIASKDYMLPRTPQEVLQLSKLILRLEKKIRHASEGLGIERVTFEGDFFCCTAGLQTQKDELGTRTLYAVKFAYIVVTEVRQWNLLAEQEGLDGASKHDVEATNSNVNNNKDVGAIALRAAVDVGSLEGSAIGKSMFQYVVTGEALAVAKCIIAHANSNHLIISRAALEGCGGKVSVVPLHPMEMNTGGVREHLIAFYVVGIEEDEVDMTHRGESGGAILDFLLTPQFGDQLADDPSNTQRKGSISMLADLQAEKSVATHVNGNVSINGSDGRNEGSALSANDQSVEGESVPVPSQLRRARGNPLERSTSLSTQLHRNHAFQHAIMKDAQAADYLRAEIEKCARSSNICGIEEFSTESQEENFLRMRLVWHIPLRIGLLCFMAMFFVIRVLWSSLCGEPAESSTISLAFHVVEGVSVMSCVAICTTRLAWRKIRYRLLQYHLWRVENIFIVVALVAAVGATFTVRSTWSRRIAPMLWIVNQCIHYSHVSLQVVIIVSIFAVAASIAFFTIVVDYWRSSDAIFITSSCVFLWLLSSLSVRQDRGFFSDVVIARAVAIVLRQKESVRRAVLRSTIPSLLHSYHKTLGRRLHHLRYNDSRDREIGTKLAGTVVVLHENLVIAQIAWKDIPNVRLVFDRVSVVENSVRGANDFLDALLKVSARNTHILPSGNVAHQKDERADHQQSSSDSETEMIDSVTKTVNPVLTTSASRDIATEKPSLCIVRTVGDVVTIAGLGSADRKQLDPRRVVGCLVAAMFHFFHRVVSLQSQSDVAGFVGVGMGASAITYDQYPKYFLFGAPTTEVVSLINASSGSIFATRNSVQHLRQIFGSDVFELTVPREHGLLPANFDLHDEIFSGIATASPKPTTVHVGPEKRWRVKGTLYRL